MSDLPCSTCHADCCGPVPLSRFVLGRIKKHLNTSGKEAILASQTRDPLTCMFVDTRDFTCSIYPVRPQLCRIYGRTDGARCPHHPTLVNIITRDTAEALIGLDREVVMFSTEYKYENQEHNG